MRVDRSAAADKIGVGNVWGTGGGKVPEEGLMRGDIYVDECARYSGV